MAKIEQIGDSNFAAISTVDRSTRRAKGRPGQSGDSVGPKLLVQRACELLVKRPSNEVTRAAVAQYAQVDPGLIRYYFKNRDSLMRAVAIELSDQLITQTQRAGGRGSAADRLAARVKSLFSFMLQQPFYHRLMTEEIAQSSDPETKAFLDTLTESAISAYQRLLDDGVLDGSLRMADPRELYVAIVGLCDFYVTGARNLRILPMRDSGHDESGYADFICELIIKGMHPSAHSTTV